MSCVVLVGMPGAGKSTIGVILAKQLAKNFVDTDVLIQTQTGQHLQTIVDRQGYLELRRIEEQILSELEVKNTVVATGGSAVYSKAAMEHLKSLGPVVYLAVSLEELERRVANLDTRGLACAPGQGLAELYGERVPLYEHYADLTVHCAPGSPPESVVVSVQQGLEQKARL